METEYCNKCGLLHDPNEGDCVGCLLIKEAYLLKLEIEILRRHMNKDTEAMADVALEVEGLK